MDPACITIPYVMARGSTTKRSAAIRPVMVCLIFFPIKNKKRPVRQEINIETILGTIIFFPKIQKASATMKNKPGGFGSNKSR